MSDSDPPPPSVHSRRRLPNPDFNTTRPRIHHSSSYHSASQSSSQPETPPYHDDFFQDAFADFTPAASRLPHFDTILNPPNSSGTERFFSPPAWPSPRRLPSPRAPSPTLPSVSAFSLPAMSNSRLPNGYVDLTHDQSSPSSPPRNSLRRAPKRNTTLQSSPESNEGTSTKRQRRSDGTGSRVPVARDSLIEEIDLVDDDKTVLQKAVQKQRMEQVKAQEHPPEKPLKMSNLTCVICMDTPTDVTATSCGHLFCHTCLMEALIAGENRTGVHEPRRSQCPVCRKLISRSKPADIIPLLMKKGLATQPRRSATPRAA